MREDANLGGTSSSLPRPHSLPKSSSVITPGEHGPLHRVLLDCLARSHALAEARPEREDPLFAHVEDLVAVQLRTLMQRERIEQALDALRAQLVRQSVELDDALAGVSRGMCGGERTDAARGGAKADAGASCWGDLLRLASDVMRVSVPRAVAATDAELSTHGVPAIRAPLAGPDPIGFRAMRRRLNVHLFGDLRVSFDGRPLRRWPRGRGQQLFKFLVIHGDGPVHKSRLIDAFWPDIDPRAARNNLNVSIYYLRQELSRYDKSLAFVEYRDECYALSPHVEVWTDSAAFDAHVCAGERHEAAGQAALAVSAYEAADALACGEFLACEAGADWAVTLREQWRRKRAEVLARLASLEMRRGDVRKCVVWARKRLSIDVCDEGAHRQLIECYVRTDQDALAERQYRTCAEALREALDVAPSSETEALMAQVRGRRRLAVVPHPSGHQREASRGRD